MINFAVPGVAYPINTAGKIPGKKILLFPCGPVSKEWRIGYWHQPSNLDHSAFWVGSWGPTHWSPLPPEPVDD